MKDYIIFWERLANSGIISGIKANSAKEAIDKVGFPLARVKLTAVELIGQAETLTLGKIG